jgi:hypothetical protein
MGAAMRLFKPAQAGFPIPAAVSNRQAYPRGRMNTRQRLGGCDAPLQARAGGLPHSSRGFQPPGVPAPKTGRL